MYKMSDVVATREAYGAALAEIGADKNLVVLDADLSKSTKTDTFKKVYPERFINCGIAEGNMISVAAGLAASGKTVFASSFAMFAAGRAFEQVRNSVGYPHLNVKIGATHAGVSVGEDGATHQCNEDVAIMRTIPGMTVIVPSDGNQAIEAVKAAYKHQGPVYLRFGRLAVPMIYDEDFKFEIGKGYQVVDGNDVTIIACGLLVNEAIIAAKELEKQGIKARVIDMPSIKPIDKDIIIKASKETGCIVCAEEHTIIGGLAGAVSEVLAENAPCPMRRVGIEDKFGKSGEAKTVCKLFGLSSENIINKVNEVMKLK